MSEDRTAPMQPGQWSRRQVEPDDQDTILAGQDSPTPPTMPAGAPRDQTWDRPPSPFVRSTPSETPTPQPQRRPPTSFPGAQPQQAEAAMQQTMLIGQQQVAPVFAWLVVAEGPDQNTIGQVHTLHPDTSTIGRVRGNHVVLHDDTCSSQHARIRVETQEDGNSAFVLYDMGSRNGTFIGDRATYKEEENRKYRHVLQDGDHLLIGETTLVFKRV